MDPKTFTREIETYVRPATFPVAAKLLQPGEAVPEKAKRPRRDFKELRTFMTFSGLAGCRVHSSPLVPVNAAAPMDVQRKSVFRTDRFSDP